MAKKDMLAMLGRVPLFEGLSKRELEAIHGAAKVTEFSAGRAIVEEGATGLAST